MPGQFQYEERIQSLEDQLQSVQGLKEGGHPHTHASALQRELDSVRDRHKKRQTELEAELAGVKLELSAAKRKDSGRSLVLSPLELVHVFVQSLEFVWIVLYI